MSCLSSVLTTASETPLGLGAVMVEIAPLQMAMTPSWIERRPSMQHTMVVDHEGVARLHANADLPTRAVQLRSQPPATSRLKGHELCCAVIQTPPRAAERRSAALVSACADTRAAAPRANRDLIGTAAEPRAANASCCGRVDTDWWLGGSGGGFAAFG